MRRLQAYEDWVLLAATLAAALSEALQTQPRLTLWALILGALAKALFSLIGRDSGGSRLLP